MSMTERGAGPGGRWFAAFSFLILAVHEAHELVHAFAARVLCGAWPLRDFNAWRFAAPCDSVWPTAAGPLFSYALMAAGAWLAARRPALRLAGLALFFAANPFARIFTVAMGGGDEMVVARRIAGLAERTTALRVAVLAVVLGLAGSALVAAWRAMGGTRSRALSFVVMMLWPMVLTGLLLFAAGNGLLRRGVLDTPVVAGAPVFVLIVSSVAILLTATTLSWLRPPNGASAPSGVR